MTEMPSFICEKFNQNKIRLIDISKNNVQVYCNESKKHFQNHRPKYNKK